jgi:uncharacterized protein
VGWFLALAGSLAVVAGGVAAVAGFGIGSILTPFLAIEHGTRVAVLLVALPHAAATALRLWMLRADVDRRVLLTFGAASAAGGLSGALLQTALGSRVLGVVLGILLIVAGAAGLSGVSARLRVRGAPLATAVGVLSGGFGGLVGNQGGIRSAALLHFDLSRTALVATATGVAMAVDLARIPVYLAVSGEEIVSRPGTVLLLAAGVLLGTVLGAPLLRRMPELLFRRLLFALLVLLGVGMVIGQAIGQS